MGTALIISGSLLGFLVYVGIALVWYGSLTARPGIRLTNNEWAASMLAWPLVWAAGIAVLSAVTYSAGGRGFWPAILTGYMTVGSFLAAWCVTVLVESRGAGPQGGTFAVVIWSALWPAALIIHAVLIGWFLAISLGRRIGQTEQQDLGDDTRPGAGV